MNWQTIVVWVIGAFAALAALRWGWRQLTGRNRCACDGCAADACPRSCGSSDKRGR